MGSWRNRPKHISELKADIPYVVAIDESGSSDLKYAKKVIKSGNEENCDENNIHFNVTACLMETSHFIESQDMIMGIKKNFGQEAVQNITEKSDEYVFILLKYEEEKMLLILKRGICTDRL